MASYSGQSHSNKYPNLEGVFVTSNTKRQSDFHLDRMVATLVIVLPSVCECGEFILLHDDWREQKDGQKAAVILDHRYSQDCLSMDALKGVDQARAEVLFEATEQADCMAHLALVTQW